jgi:hypothetical protein
VGDTANILIVKEALREVLNIALGTATPTVVVLLVVVRMATVVVVRMILLLLWLFLYNI